MNTNESNTIKIEADEGFEPPETITINGDEYTLTKKEQPKELSDSAKLESLEKQLDEFAKKQEHQYYLSSIGSIRKSETYDFSNNNETVINAERMWLMWRRLAEMLNDGDKKGGVVVYWHKDNEKLEITTFSYLYGSVQFKDRETALKAVQMFGENNVVWMLKNL